MDCLRTAQLPRVASLIVFVSCLMMPNLALASQHGMAELSAIFVLGLAIPFFLFTLLIRKIVTSSGAYAFMLLAATFGLLFTLSSQIGSKEAIMLSAAVLMQVTSCFWLISQEIKEDVVSDESIISYFGYSKKVVLFIALLYLVSLWLLPVIDAYLSWLIFSGISLLVVAALIIVRIRYKASDVYRLVLHWLVQAAFVCTLFFWLNAQVTELWLVVTLLLAFMMNFYNGYWHDLTQLLEQSQANQCSQSNNNQAEQSIFTHDPATNLPNYQQALSRFDGLTKEFPDKKFAAIVIKPINFERVNQVLGHQNSDILLLQLAYCLQRAVESNELLVNFEYGNRFARLARLQSLHFLAIVDLSKTKFSEKVTVDDLCKQLAQAVPAAMSFKSFTLNFELACGVAFTGEHGSTVSEVVAHAGDALLGAKLEQSLVHYYSRENTLYNEQQLLKMERLKLDIQEDNLTWFAVPEIDSKTKQIKALMLDVRWRHLGDEMLSLEEFIDIAENSGELHLISKHMIKNAFKLLYELKKISVYLPISVPMSSRTILEPDLAEYIEQQIAKYNIAGKYLMIELTEPMMVMAVDRAKSMIDQLKTLEVGISIDDFTGSYESLRYIRKLSVDQVKISCQQLVSTQQESAEKAIVNSLINLARTMKLPLVATHVDTVEICNTFQAMGGTVIQGQAVSSGVAVNEVGDWIESWYKNNPEAKPQ